MDALQGAKEGEGLEEWFEARKREWDLSGPFGLEKDLADARDAVAVAERALAARMAEQAAANYTEAMAALRAGQEEAQARRQSDLTPTLTLTLTLTLNLTLTLTLTPTPTLTLTLTLTRFVLMGDGDHSEAIFGPGVLPPG